MRLRVALLLYCLLLMFLEASAGKCRKKKSGKKCDKVALGPPRWRRRGKDTMFVERELATVTFKCQARGNPRPRYKWYRDGKLIEKRSKKYRKKKNRLTVSSLQMADTGSYTCEVYNALGALNKTFTLRVLSYKPDMSEISINERPSNKTVQVGDSVVFRCSTDTYPRPTIEWSRQIHDSPRVDILQKPSNRARAEMFMLDHVTKEDAGLYSCTIKNKKQARQLTAKLTVIGEGEELPFEPKCGLHVRKQIVYDGVYGCQTRKPVMMTYCMGSCGRSYYVPTLVPVAANSSSSSSPGASPPVAPATHANQTCQCCVGLVQGLHVISLDCPSGDTIKAFFTTLRGCACRSCNVEDEMSPKLLTTRSP